MTALIIHESFVKQRQQTLPRCDLFNVTISFLFLCFVLTSSSIIFRKHPIPFLGHAKTCFLALPARWIKKKDLHELLPKVFHTQRCLWPLAMSIFLLNDNYATCGLGRGIKLQTLWPISTLCVFCFFLLVWVDEKEKKSIKRIRIRAAVSNVTVAFERKQNIGISIWSWDPIGS